MKKDSFLPIGSCFPLGSAAIFHQGAFLGTIAAPRKSTAFVNRVQCIDHCSRRRQVQAGGPALVTEVAQEINLGRAFQSIPHQPRVDAIEIFGFHRSQCTACSAALSPHFIEKLLWKTPVSGNLQFESKNRSFSPAGSLYGASMKVLPVSVTRSLSRCKRLTTRRWRAVLRRDRRADGNFVFGGRDDWSLLPALPAPLVERAESMSDFLKRLRMRRKAGFRACQRCHPNGTEASTERQAALVTAACRRIETAEESPSLAPLANAAG